MAKTVAGGGTKGKTIIAVGAKGRGAQWQLPPGLYGKPPPFGWGNNTLRGLEGEGGNTWTGGARTMRDAAADGSATAVRLVCVCVCVHVVRDCY